MSKRGPGEVTNKERGASAGGEPHPERAEPLLVREEPRPQPQEGLNGDESAKDIFEETQMPDVVNEEPQPDEQIRAPVLQKTWQETAAAAGVVTMVREDVREEETPLSHLNLAEKSLKKKTPLQYRKEEPKLKNSAKPLTMAEKKLFKEAFLTDKARLFKRQTKYKKERNFIVIVEDNVLGKGAQTNGKLMVYGCGSIKERFMTNGIKFNSEEFYMHANHTDFQEESVRKTKSVLEAEKSEKAPNKRKNVAEKSDKVQNTDFHAKKFKPKKVATPGTYLDETDDSSSDD